MTLNHSATFHMWEVSYCPTGAGEHYTPRRVDFSTGDVYGDIVVRNVADVCKAFEIWTAERGTYENANAIVNIRLVYEA